MRQLPNLRAAYDDHEPISHETGLECKDKTLAQQQFAEECDINTIVDKFLKTGEMPSTVQVPAYADYEDIFDFQTAMNVIRAAQENFDSMPAKIRSRFDNNPQKFFDFCQDPDNKEEARRLGLLQPIAEPPAPLPEAPKPVENTPPAPPQPKPTA